MLGLGVRCCGLGFVGGVYVFMVKGLAMEARL